MQPCMQPGRYSCSWWKEKKSSVASSYRLGGMHKSGRHMHGRLGIGDRGAFGFHFRLFLEACVLMRDIWDKGYDFVFKKRKKS